MVDGFLVDLRFFDLLIKLGDHHIAHAHIAGDRYREIASGLEIVNLPTHRVSRNRRIAISAFVIGGENHARSIWMFRIADHPDTDRHRSTAPYSASNVSLPSSIHISISHVHERIGRIMGAATKYRCTIGPRGEYSVWHWLHQV